MHLGDSRVVWGIQAVEQCQVDTPHRLQEDIPVVEGDTLVEDSPEVGSPVVGSPVVGSLVEDNPEVDSPEEDNPEEDSPEGDNLVEDNPEVGILPVEEAGS